jgi:pimeloyl-ACP methyl ester carboxylesterase
LRYRPGVGVPLLVIHYKAADQSDRWIRGLRSHGGRPAAAFGAEDMGTFQSSAIQVVQDLLDATGWRGSARIDVVGYSLGGFAALLFGALMALALPATAVTVIACSPPVCLWPMPDGPRNGRHRAAIEAALAATDRCEHVEQFGDTRPWIAKAGAMREDSFRVRLLYPERNRWDARQAELLQGAPGVKLVPMPTAAHAFFLLVKLGDDREAEIGYTQTRLQAGDMKTEAEAREEATLLRDALWSAVSAEPDLFGILVSKPRQVKKAAA